MGEGTEKLRLFVAIHVPDSIKEGLRRMQQELRSVSGDSVRWSSPEQLHMTLLFLGYVESGELRRLEEAFEAVCPAGGTMKLSVQGLGCFPNERRPRVIWAGCEGEVEGLQAFQKELQRALKPWCEKEETRDYRPHLTLGRAREGASVRRLSDTLREQAGAFFGDFVAEGCSLMRSHLSPHGATYEELRGCRFLR